MRWRALKVSYGDLSEGGIAMIYEKTQFFLNTLYHMYENTGISDIIRMNDADRSGCCTNIMSFPPSSSSSTRGKHNILEFPVLFVTNKLFLCLIK